VTYIQRVKRVDEGELVFDQLSSTRNTRESYRTRKRRKAVVLEIEVSKARQQRKFRWKSRQAIVPKGNSAC
jgi:hypothetical protein